jgi:hypothetical protein
MERSAGQTLSFTDCVGAVTARDASADTVFGLDRDLAMLGFAPES